MEPGRCGSGVDTRRGKNASEVAVPGYAAPTAKAARAETESRRRRVHSALASRAGAAALRGAWVDAQFPAADFEAVMELSGKAKQLSPGAAENRRVAARLPAGFPEMVLGELTEVRPHGSLFKFQQGRAGYGPLTAELHVQLRAQYEYEGSHLSHRERLRAGIADLNAELHSSWRAMVDSGAHSNLVLNVAAPTGTGSAASSSAPVAQQQQQLQEQALTPRQRRLAQQRRSAPSLPTASTSTSAPAPSTRWPSLFTAIGTLSAAELVGLAKHWTQELVKATAAAATSSSQPQQPAPLSQQHLADLVWAVAHYDWGHCVGALAPAMAVPFAVVPQFMPGLKLQDFMAEVRLNRDVIYLEDGSKYSGKEMVPDPSGMTPAVRKVRDELQRLTGVWYDSVLINYYGDGKCGMRYHVDPLYGVWSPESAVVSIGDTRTFIFREISDYNSRWQYRVRNGDVVRMWGDCQDRLQHCVRVERAAEDAGPRMSLVFKERLRGPGGEYLQETAGNGTGGLVTRAGREPLDWLPPGWKPPAGNASSALLHNLTLALPTCDTLWDLAAAECTFRASARWPTPGLQAGAAFLFYRSVQGLRSAAVAVNITCPPDLDRHIRCGDELVAALAALQQSAARVLLTLAANVSLPPTGGPTPMRLAVAPEDGLSLAARVYRNVTLASAGEVPGGAEGLRPVLTLAHVHIVNIPPGPPSSWPMGLMSTFHWWLGGTDKVGPVAPQLIALRCATTGTPAELSYQLGWYRLLVAVSRADRDKAAWMASWANPLLQVRSPEDGTITTYNQAGAFRAYYNTSVQTKVLLTTPGANEFDMWTDLPAVPPPAAALANTTGAAAPAAAALLPPTAFAFANSTAELLALMQEPWVGTGSSAPYGRFIFLLRNMSLSADDGLWPQGGAALSYNVTLFGPTRGYPPVRLDTGSLPLVSAAAAAPSASAVVLVRFLRLQLAGSIVRALTAVPRAAVADAPPDAAVVLAATPELRAWRDRCLGSAAANSTGGSSTGVAPATATGTAAVWQAEAYSSVLELPAASLVPLLAPTTPAAAANATAAGGLPSQLQLPAGPASALVALAALSQPGAVVYPSVYNNSSSTVELLLRNGSLLLPGGDATTSGGSSGSSGGSWLAAYGSSLLATPSASASVEEGACDAGSLLMILQSLSDSQRGAAAAAGAANASSTSSGGPESGRGGGKPVPGAYAPPRVLGRGAFGVVVLGEWRGLPAAIKVMMFTAGDAKRAHRLAREVALTTSLSHPHVVPTYNYTLETLPADGGAPSVLGPAAIKSGGRREVAAAMAETLAADDPLAVPLALVAALDVLSGLRYLHACNVVHGDLSENNILSMRASGLAGWPAEGQWDEASLARAVRLLLGVKFKISDLGLSMTGDAQTHISNMRQGTPVFAAPELVASGRLAPAADMYSFGVVLWLLLHGVSLGQVSHLLPRSAIIPAHAALLRHSSPELPPAAAALLADCLAPSPADRPTAAAAREREVLGPELAVLVTSGCERH
eukprot:XP_001695604.1 predicted protein [Chlamydomonas reinhardtii]